ncbi:hypothetical protein Hanom_Chr11g00981721 [Helianthus anomalus]
MVNVLKANKTNMFTKFALLNKPLRMKGTTQCGWGDRNEMSENIFSSNGSL